MKHGNPNLAPHLKAARRAMLAAQSAFRRALREEQARCSHGQVIQCPGLSCQHFWRLPAQRMCLVCGLVEHADQWYGDTSWPSHRTTSSNSCETNYKAPTVLRAEFVKRVSREAFRCLEIKP